MIGAIAFLRRRHRMIFLRAEAAIALFHQSLAIFEHIGDAQGQAATRRELGKLKANQGDTDGAIQLFEESLASTDQIGWIPGKWPTLSWLASIAEQQGDLAKALACREEELAIREQIKAP